MAEAGSVEDNPKPTPQTNLDHSYWKSKLPRGFQLYIDRLARGLIRVQPSNGPEFAAVLMEELLAQRTRELNNLPEVPYLEKLKDKVQRRGRGGVVELSQGAGGAGSRKTTPAPGDTGRVSAMSTCCSCCGRNILEIQSEDEDAISEVSCPCTEDKGETTCVICLSQENVIQAVGKITEVKPRPQLYSCQVQTQDPGQDVGTQVAFGTDAGVQVCPVHSPSPVPTPTPPCPVHSPTPPTTPRPDSRQGVFRQTQTDKSALSPRAQTGWQTRENVSGEEAYRSTRLSPARSPKRPSSPSGYAMTPQRQGDSLSPSYAGRLL